MPCGTALGIGGFAMNMFRLLLCASSAAGLIGLGVSALLKTTAAWEPCVGAQTTDACLSAMDTPAHVVPLQLIWLVCIVLAVGAVAGASAGIARGFSVAALTLMIVMNYVTEYLLWSLLHGGHWDVPPGTGYSQSGAMVLAGVLIAVGVLVSARTSEEQRYGRGRHVHAVHA